MSALDRICRRLDAGLPARLPFFSITERERVRQYAYRWARHQGIAVHTLSRGDRRHGHVFVYAGKAEAPAYVPTAIRSTPEDLVRDVIAAGRIARVELAKFDLEQAVAS